MPYARTLAPFAVVLAISAAHAAPSAAALPPQTTTATAPVKRIAGVCPRRIVVKTYARPYEGGANFEIVAQLAEFADRIRVRRIARDGVAFDGALRPRFARCDGSAVVSDGGNRTLFTFRDRSVRFVFQPSPELQELKARIVRGNPSVTGAVAD